MSGPNPSKVSPSNTQSAPKSEYSTRPIPAEILELREKPEEKEFLKAAWNKLQAITLPDPNTGTHKIVDAFKIRPAAPEDMRNDDDIDGIGIIAGCRLEEENGDEDTGHPNPTSPEDGARKPKLLNFARVALLYELREKFRKDLLRIWDAEIGQGGVEIGQGGVEIGQEGVEMGQEGVEIGQEGVEMGQEGVEMGQEGVEMGQKRVFIDPLTDEEFERLRKMTEDYKEWKEDLGVDLDALQCWNTICNEAKRNSSWQAEVDAEWGWMFEERFPDEFDDPKSEDPESED